MKRDPENRSLTYDDLIDCLQRISDGNLRFCKGLRVKYGLDGTIDKGKLEMDSLHPPGSALHRPIHVVVGTRTLDRNVIDGCIRDRDFVMALFKGFHESAHLWQNVIGYRQPPDGISEPFKHMARTRAVCLFSEEYHDMIRVFDPSEIFADGYACFRLGSFVKERAQADEKYKGLDVDRVVCPYIKSLYGPSWAGNIQGDTVEEMSMALEAMFRIAPAMKKLRCGSTKWPDDEALIAGAIEMFGNAEVVRSAICAIDGVEETEILCEYIGECKPECFRSLLCVKDEYIHKNSVGFVESGVGKILHVVPTDFIGLTESDGVKTKADDGLDGP